MKTKKPQAAPTPLGRWRFFKAADGPKGYYLRQIDAEGTDRPRAVTLYADDDGADIVRAVNAHDALVKCAEKAKLVCSLFGTDHPQGIAELRQAVFELRELERAALKAAEARP